MSPIRLPNLIVAAALGAVLAACSLSPLKDEAAPEPVEPVEPEIILGEPLATHRFEIDPETDVVGQVQVVIIGEHDTLSDVARRFNVGYDEIVRANPGVDPWLPGVGREVVVPTQFVLPAAERKGIVVNLAAMRLFYFPTPKKGEPQVVYTHPIGIGKVGWSTPEGTTKVTGKEKDPVWRPTASIREEHRKNGDPLPAVVPPGPDNPLGKYKLTLGWPTYLIHGTNKPYGVGMRTSHGCIRMYPEDIEFLFGRVAVDTPVRIINEPVKLGWDGDRLLVEVHRSLETAPVVDEDLSAVAIDTGEAAEPAPGASASGHLTALTRQFVAATGTRPGELDWALAESLLERADGIPVPVGSAIKNAATSAAFE